MKVELTREQVLAAFPKQIREKYPSILATAMDKLFGPEGEQEDG